MKYRTVLALLMVLFLFPRVEKVSASVTPIPTPATQWTSGPSGVFAPRKNFICWGDQIGPYFGPVVVKFFSDQPQMVMVYAGCEYAPNLSAEDRSIWAYDNYGRYFSYLDAGVPTNTPTPTSTNSVTPSYTVTSSKTFTRTNTPTYTFTLTSTLTPSKTVTPSKTLTASLTPTETETPTITESPTDTETPTETETPTNTPTETETLTPTQTPTRTYTLTKTYTKTLTSTRTKTSTRTPTLTRTWTKTPTKTATVYTGPRGLAVHWDSRGATLLIIPKYRFICWGVINGVPNLVVFYRVDYTYPESINGQCQTLNVWNIDQIQSYLQWRTGKVWNKQLLP